MNLYMFRAVPLPIIRSSFTVHLALLYVIQVCRQLSSRAGMELVALVYVIQVFRQLSSRAGMEMETSSIPALLKSCLQTCMTYTSAMCTVNELLMMGRGTARNM
jgi:hypothetical protein